MKKQILSALIVCSLASTAQSGGYQLNDYSITGLGRAYAGVGIVGDDYSAVAFNPAGMKLMKDGFQTGLTAVKLKSDIDNKANDATGKMKFYAPLPHFFGQKRLSDKVVVGLGIYTPFGLATRYKKDWFASHVAVKSHLAIVDFAPAVSYQISNKWTVGGTFIARYIKGHMTNIMPNPLTKQAVQGSWSEFKLDGWTVSGVLGAMYEPTKDTRFGFSWRLKSTQQVKGDHKLSYDLSPYAGLVAGTPAAPFARNWSDVSTGRASPDLPETFILSGYHNINHKLALSGTVRYTRWSRSFEKFALESETPFFQMALNGAKVQNYKWKDSWTLTVGADYQLNDRLTLRFGTGYDESPSHDKYRRTVRIPDTDRYWLSLGASYKFRHSVIDVGYTHMFAKKTDVVDEGFDMEYDSSSNILGVSYQYRF